MAQFKKLKLILKSEDTGTRLDRCLSRLIQDSSRSYLQKISRGGGVTCDGVVVLSLRFEVAGGMKIEVVLEEPSEPTLKAENFEFEILYEDTFMLVINKPPNVVVHPAAGNPSGTVVNALLGRYPFMAETLAISNSRPGIVHRLDKDTSGVLVVAKTPQAQFHLAKSFADRKVQKTYQALIAGIPREPTCRIETLIGRHPVARQKMAVVERSGKHAITIYRVKESGLIEGIPASLVEVDILTGRTHQIRVHMAHIGPPVAGDPVYGGQKRLPMPRQMLHAWRLRIPHPESNEIMSFEAPLPEDFMDALKQMRRVNESS